MFHFSKKPGAKRRELKQASKTQPTIGPTEYRCYIEEGILYATAGAVTPSWNASFVLRATPRPGGT